MADTSVTRTYLTARDRLIAALLGILFLVASAIWGVHGMDPSQWNEMAIAVGLRPPHAIFPGLWRILAGTLFTVFGLDSAVHVLVVAGWCIGAASVALVYLTTRDVLSRLLRAEAEHPVWEKAIAPFFASVSAILFGVSTPLWDVSQTFSPDGLRIFLLFLATYIWFRWFARGGAWRLYTVVALVGMLAAETPFAFLIPLFFLTWYFKIWRGIVDGVYAEPEHLPNPDQLPCWRMFFLFLGVLAIMVWVNVSSFVTAGGLEANGWESSDVYFRYGAGYWHVLADASTMIGWALGLGFGVFPVVVALRLFPVLTRDDQPMPFHLGAILFFVGFVAVLQTGVFPGARFWMFSKESVIVGSQALLTFFSFTSAVTVALFGACFAFECQRFYLQDGEKKPGVMLRYLSPVIALALVVASLGQVVRDEAHEAQRVVDDAVAETVRECGDAKWLFTDGLLDPGLELAAFALGKELTPLNLMSGASDWEKALRVRSFPSGIDRETAEMGIPALLRVWAGEKVQGMEGAAIQLGFEFWKRSRKPLPKLSGMVARESGMSDAEAARGIKASRELAERVVDVSSRIGRMNVTPALASAISAISWRLSRFARLRNDEKLADRLDATNGTIKRMLSIIEYERQRTFMQLTPREGLEIALKRADFVEARRYAAAVVRVAPKDPAANFGLGMAALKDGLLEESEKYLRVVLETRPDEPAVLNNLSIICRKGKRYDEAVELAKHALRMLPDSPEVKQTLADAEAKNP